jgi:hypothetical protein
MGHETPETPILLPAVNSSALPLKSRITFPVLTSKIFRTTLYKIKNTIVRKENHLLVVCGGGGGVVKEDI